MGGGGSDGGFEQRQQEQEARKQQARDSLNTLFGMEGSTTGKPKAVDRNSFFRRGEQFVRPQLSVLEQKQAGGPMTFGVDGSAGDVGASGMDQNADLVFDDGAFGAAQAEAQAQAEAEAASVGQNRQARDSLYQRVRDNAFGAGKRRLDEDHSDAARKLKFELFATGNAGGSEDINQNSRLKRTYTQGLMDLGGKADAARADFRGADESARLQLLQSIDAGMDQGSALSSAAQQMQVAADKAAADANGTAVGDLFDNAGLMYEQSQYAKGRQAGQEWWNQMRPSGQRGFSGAATGVTTRLPGE